MSAAIQARTIDHRLEIVRVLAAAVRRSPIGREPVVIGRKLEIVRVPAAIGRARAAIVPGTRPYPDLLPGQELV